MIAVIASSRVPPPKAEAAVLAHERDDLRKLLEITNDFMAKLRQVPTDATVFVYFSGHGAKEGEVMFQVVVTFTL